MRRNWGERNFSFDSLKYMNYNMEEKGIVARDFLPPEPRWPPRGTTAAKHHHPAACSGQPAGVSRQWAARGSSVAHFFVILITVLLLVLWRITRQTLFSGIFTTRLVVGVISAMVEKELGERNFGFDSLKYMTHDMEEIGIVARYFLQLRLRFPLPAVEGPPPRRCPLPEAVVP